jgi:hypothetical protein
LDRLRQLYQAYHGEVAFVLVYIREGPHEQPAEVQNAYLKAGLLEETTSSRCQRIEVGLEALELPFPCLVDEEDGAVEALYHAFPERLVVVGRDGHIVHDAGRGIALDGQGGWDYEAIENALLRKPDLFGTPPQ